MRKAVHIYLSTFENESRILKQTKSIIDNNIVDRVIVLARGAAHLPVQEEFGKNRIVYRIRSQFWKDKTPAKIFRPAVLLLKFVDGVYKYCKIIKREKPLYINLHQVDLLPLMPLFKIASRRSIFIYDAHELETETNGLIGISKKIKKIIESFFIRYFRKTFVVSKSIEDWYREEYGIKSIATVMNCPNYANPRKSDKFRQEFNIPQEATIFLYQGALFKGRGIEVIMEVFSDLNPEKFALVIMGRGGMEDEIIQYATKFRNIYFKEAVHPAVVLDYTSSADVGISLIENVCLSYNYCLPNKLFEYLMAGIPSIVSNLDEMSKYIESYMAGIICRDTSKEALKTSVLAMEQFDFVGFQKNLDSLKRMFSWEAQEKIMIREYQNLQK